MSDESQHGRILVSSVALGQSRHDDRADLTAIPAEILDSEGIDIEEDIVEDYGSLDACKELFTSPDIILENNTPSSAKQETAHVLEKDPSRPNTNGVWKSDPSDVTSSIEEDISEEAGLSPEKMEKYVADLDSAVFAGNLRVQDSFDDSLDGIFC